MDRRGFLKAFGFGAVAAAAVPSFVKSAPIETVPSEILATPRPWQSKLTGKWYGYNHRKGEWVEVAGPTP